MNITNLLRRVNRFNKTNPTFAIEVDRSRLSNKRYYQSIERRLKSAQAIVRANESAARYALKYRNLVEGAGSQSDWRPKQYRTLKAAKRAAKDLYNRYRREMYFRRERAKLQEEIADYNRTAQNSRRFTSLPTDASQLRKYREAFTRWRNRDYSGALKVLGVERKNTNDPRRDLSKFEAQKPARERYADLELLRTTILAAEATDPRLGDLFRNGGVSLVMELHGVDYNIHDWYKSDDDADIENIWEQLEYLADTTLSPGNAALVYEYLN